MRKTEELDLLDLIYERYTKPLFSNYFFGDTFSRYQELHESRIDITSKIHLSITQRIINNSVIGVTIGIDPSQYGYKLPKNYTFNKKFIKLANMFKQKSNIEFECSDTYLECKFDYQTLELESVQKLKDENQELRKSLDEKNFLNIIRENEKLDDQLFKYKKENLNLRISNRTNNNELQTKEINDLKIELEKLRLENSKFKELQKNNVVQKLKNERGAGRKAKFSQEDKEKMKELRSQGLSIRQIAKEFSCSAGIVHKLINEQQSDE